MGRPSTRPLATMTLQMSNYVVDRSKPLFRILPMAPSLCARPSFRSARCARSSRSWAQRAGGRTVSFACAPENLRLGNAIDVFKNPDRVVIGVRDDWARAKIQSALAR